MQCQLIFYCVLDGVLTDFENHLLKEIRQVLPPHPTWAHMPAFDSIGELRQHLGHRGNCLGDPVRGGEPNESEQLFIQVFLHVWWGSVF